MQKTQHLTDEEIDRLGYQALKEKLGTVGAVRFLSRQAEHAGDDYAEIRNKIFEDMTVRDIYKEAVRLEDQHEKRSIKD